MKFSIITVCFNAEASLPGARNSLACQTFKDYEWIVIDGGSRDDTVRLASEFEAAPMLVVSEPDQGIYDAMNKGIARATGDYLFFLNSDDAFADENVLADCAAAIDAAGAPDLIVGRILYVNSEKRVLRDFSHITSKSLLTDTLCHQATFARRSLFEKIGCFDLGYRMAADYDWFIRSFRSQAKVEFVTRLLVVFSGEGAHVLQAEKTRREIISIRKKYAGRFFYPVVVGWHRLSYCTRRIFGLQAVGHLPVT